MTRNGVPLVLGAVGLLAAAGAARRRGGSNKCQCECPCPCGQGGGKTQRATGVKHLIQPVKGYLDLAGDDKAFARWLKKVDDDVLFWTMGQGVHDLEPRKWREAYDAGQSPLDAVNELIGDTSDPSGMLMAQLELTT